MNYYAPLVPVRKCFCVVYARGFLHMMYTFPTSIFFQCLMILFIDIVTTQTTLNQVKTAAWTFNNSHICFGPVDSFPQFLVGKIACRVLVVFARVETHAAYKICDD